MEDTLQFDNTSTQSTCLGNFSLQSITALFGSPDCFKHGAPFSVFLIILFVFLFIHGIVGNSLVVYVLSRRARLWSETNMFILNLALSDLSVVSFCLPATLVDSVFKPWILGKFACKMTTYVRDVCVFVSVYSLVAISLDRYIAVRLQANPTVGFTNMQTKHGVFLIWLLALASTLPWALKFNIVYSEVDQLIFCQEPWTKQLDNMLYFIFANAIVRFFIPLVTIVFLTFGIHRTIENYTVPLHWSPAFHYLRKRKRVNILKLVVGLSSAFFICWLPLFAVLTIGKVTGSYTNTHNNNSSEVYTTIPLLHVLGFLNCCVNPLLYAYLDDNFKISFQSLFGITPTVIQSEEGVTYRRRRDEEGRFQEVVEIDGPQANEIGLENNN